MDSSPKFPIHEAARDGRSTWNYLPDMLVVWLTSVQLLSLSLYWMWDTRDTVIRVFSYSKPLTGKSKTFKFERWWWSSTHSLGCLLRSLRDCRSACWGKGFWPWCSGTRPLTQFTLSALISNLRSPLLKLWYWFRTGWIRVDTPHDSCISQRQRTTCRAPASEGSRRER